MTVTLLAATLDAAHERKLIDYNPARGRGRRVRERAPARSSPHRGGQTTALLDGAGQMDRDATRERAHLERRACLAVMTFAGLRISEVCSLRWRDVDVAAGWITVGESKTDAGRRRIRIRGALRDELLAVRGRRSTAPDGYVFPTRTGRRQYESKVRTATLAGAVKVANRNLEQAGHPPLPQGLTPHSLRRTFCSLLYALGVDPGHGDGRNGPHGPRARAEDLPAGDASPRRRPGGPPAAPRGRSNRSNRPTARFR